MFEVDFDSSFPEREFVSCHLVDDETMNSKRQN